MYFRESSFSIVVLFMTTIVSMKICLISLCYCCLRTPVFPTAIILGNWHLRTSKWPWRPWFQKAKRQTHNTRFCCIRHISTHKNRLKKKKENKRGFYFVLRQLPFTRFFSPHICSIIFYYNLSISVLELHTSSSPIPLGVELVTSSSFGKMFYQCQKCLRLWWLSHRLRQKRAGNGCEEQWQ